MKKNFKKIWDFLKANRLKLENLSSSQHCKLEKLEKIEHPTEYQQYLINAYREQLKDISSYLNDINEVMCFASPDLHIVLVHDIIEYNNLISEADDFENSYEGTFSTITWMCKFPYKECFLIWMESPNNLKRLKGKYLP